MISNNIYLLLNLRASIILDITFVDIFMIEDRLTLTSDIHHGKP
jgi:hypothetical protein